MSSCLDRPALEGEQTSRTFLDEQDDQHQDRDRAEHSACKWLKELVGHAECERADQRSPQIAHAAEHHHHETVDDVALAEIGADIVDLPDGHDGTPSNPGTE